MKNVLIIGAGRSATSLITYMLKHAEKNQWEVVVADMDVELARKKVGRNPHGKAISFDVFNGEKRERLVKEADLVISLLPAHLHIHVASDCVKYSTNLVTASYISDEMRALDQKAKEAGIILLNELGADPGIDHLSAMETIDGIEKAGGELQSFRSYCGAVVAPESMNEWGYKFTWSPKNVVLAGQGGTAVHRNNNKTKYIPYNRLFRQIESIEIPGYGAFEAYANRDSLQYAEPYGLGDIDTIYRGTLRHKGYCPAWNALIRLGLTDDRYKIHNEKDLTWAQFTDRFVPEIEGKTLRERVEATLAEDGSPGIMKKLDWLGIFDDKKIETETASPAETLQKLLMKKWLFEEGDVDMIVMQHQYEYSLKGKNMYKISSMVTKGLDHDQTAIARTVGIPAAIGGRLIMEGKVPQKGVQLPIYPEIYQPLLNELDEEFGISFEHAEKEV